MDAFPHAYRKTSALFLGVLLSACATHPDIPVPVAPVQKGVQMSEADGITAPSQKAWAWDENRWFTAELDHRCRGPIRFVDAKNGIDSYVGNDEVPNMTFASDDPDVVLGTLYGAYKQLVFSTDGGRHFVQEVRGLPDGQSTKFIIVKNGHIYVGMKLYDSDADGYFDWQQPGYRSEWTTTPAPLEDSRLVILEAPVDKAKGRLGWYQLLAPAGYTFRSKYANEQDIKRIEDINALGLPHVAGPTPKDACGRTLPLPPWSTDWTKENLLKFYGWYDETKIAHPGWATPEKDAFVAWHRNWHRATLIPGATTPRR